MFSDKYKSLDGEWQNKLHKSIYKEVKEGEI